MENDIEEVEIRIDFVRGKGDPARIFRTMTGLIEAATDLDCHFSQMIGVSVQTRLILQDIEAASLKAKLGRIVEEIPKEAIKEANARKIIGHFLHKATNHFLNWSLERNSVNDRSEVKKLQSDLHDLAEETDLKVLPAYSEVEADHLFQDMNTISDALSNLDKNDIATYGSPIGNVNYNPDFHVPENVVRDVITRETISTKGERILKVKKPDYLGTSKWVFKYGHQTIEAKILDQEWLDAFQRNYEQVNPGDSLRVILSEEVSYGYDNDVVHTYYEITQVIDIIKGPKLIQGDMLKNKNDF